MSHNVAVNGGVNGGVLASAMVSVFLGPFIEWARIIFTLAIWIMAILIVSIGTGWFFNRNLPICDKGDDVFAFEFAHKSPLSSTLL
jgi:hypothetical protein